MAVTRRTLRLAKELRIVVDGITDTATRRLVEAWARAWREVDTEFLAAVQDLIAVGDGAWPTRAQVARAERAMRALEHATREVVALSEFTGVTVVTAAREVTAEIAQWQARIIASQMPKAAGTDVELVARFGRHDPDALSAIVERTTEQVTSLTRPLSGNAREAMLRSLVRGVAVGDNPRTAAARMLRTVQGDFAGGLTRALTIARTEILDAHRSAAAAQHFANEDVLGGWQWLAQLDKRTCPACWAKHGSVHELSETGPDDHQQGRCARLPVVKTWKQLGFAIPEPASVLPDARSVFDALPAADRLAILGPTRLLALDSGVMDLSGFATKRTTAGWRDSWVPTPVGVVQRALVRSA